MIWEDHSVWNHGEATTLLWSGCIVITLTVIGVRKSFGQPYKVFQANSEVVKTMKTAVR
jgi:hypothetical protein